MTTPELQQVLQDAQQYRKVMDLLQDLRVPHSLCTPRWRRACVACNAVEELNVMLAEYQGKR